ncbi:MAG: protease inhibitor I42 family protein [Akkermansia sp.]
MNTFTTTLIAAMAAVSTVQAASPSAPAPACIAARHINLNIGQTHLFELPSNASTGYSWQLEQAPTQDSAAAIKIAPLPAKPNNVVGVPNNSLVTITGQQAGTQECKLVYIRAGEKDSTPQKTVSLIIKVQ